ncbi:MAG: DUF1294 domain-containing protein [Sedimentibacter sp.]
MSKLQYTLTYFACINIASFIVFFLDKEKAIKDKWRVQEKTLHTLSFLGGVFGSIASMMVFHHKTKKPLFVAITILALLFNIYVYYMVIKNIILLQ